MKPAAAIGIACMLVAGACLQTPEHGDHNANKAEPAPPGASAPQGAAQQRTANTAPDTTRKAQRPDAASTRFDANAFPPTLSDTTWHAKAWLRNDCLRCHETGVGDAPEVRHRGMPDILMTAVCRSCHVLVKDSKPRQFTQPVGATRFDVNAFPPMMPNSESHRNAWMKDDCMMCHASGVAGAPVVVHKGLPELLLESKCRTCHVQVRAIERPNAQ